MGILSSATLFNRSKDTKVNREQEADMIWQLGKFWSKSQKTNEQLIHSDMLGDLMLSVGENRKRLDNSSTVPKLSKLPGDLYYRYKDTIRATINYQVGKGRVFTKGNNFYSVKG